MRCPAVRLELPYLFPPIPPENEVKRKQRKPSRNNLYLPPWAAYSSIPSASSNAEACSSSTSIPSLSPDAPSSGRGLVGEGAAEACSSSTSIPSLSPGTASSGGDPGGEGATEASSPRRGGGDDDIRPSASCLASPLLGHTFACAEWGPRQLTHLATTCAHAVPWPTKHPSTGHLCLSVWCLQAHSVQRAFRVQRASMWPHLLQRPH